MQRFFSLIVLSVLLLACQHAPKRITSIDEQMQAIDASLDYIQDTAYLRALEPLKAQMQQKLDIKLGYAPEALTIKQPECTMLNWASDALYDMSYIVRTEPTADFAVVNIGGMRAEWPAGDITWRHVYELMPFDNRMVVLTLTGQDVLDLCQIFAQQGGQGVSKTLRMQIKNKQAQNITINGKAVVADALYYVVTSDYLSTGADHFTPLTNAIEKVETGIRIRDLYAEYVERVQIVKAEIDGRMQIVE